MRTRITLWPTGRSKITKDYDHHRHLHRLSPRRIARRSHGWVRRCDRGMRLARSSSSLKRQ